MSAVNDVCSRASSATRDWYALNLSGEGMVPGDLRNDWPDGTGVSKLGFASLWAGNCQGTAIRSGRLWLRSKRMQAA